MPRNKVVWRRLVFVVLIIASLALLTVSFRESESGPVYSVQQAGVSILSPLQSWSARVAEPFQNGFRWIRTIWSAHKDAERLATELQLLQGEAVKLKEQAEENQRLRSLLDFQEKGTFPEGTAFKVARVTGKSPTRWQAWIQIDKGSADGVRIDQAVVGATPIAGGTLAGKGLVGKVMSVTAHEAQVQLITDSGSSVSAKIQGSRAEGIVEGSVSGKLIMDFVDRDISVDPKLVIVTSGYGGIYPPAIPIGIVASVGEEDVNIYKEIEVQSFVDFRVIEEVMVLIGPSSAGPTAPMSTTVAPTIAVPTSTTAPTGTAAPTGTTVPASIPTSASTTTTTTVGSSGQ